MRFDMPEAEAEAEAQAGPIRSRAHLGRQLVARLLTTSHPHFSPLRLYTLRLFAKRGQCDFSSQPPRNSLLVYNYRYAFRLLFSVTLCGNFLICLSSLLLFISLAWLSLGFSVSVSLSGPQRALLRFCCQAILQRLLSKLRNVTAYA